MTSIPPDAPSDGDLAVLLTAVKRGDDTDDPLDNQRLASLLDLSLEDVAKQLEIAKGRRLIWGIRAGYKPGPWYTDLELTVQGRRFLAHNPPG